MFLKKPFTFEFLVRIVLVKAIVTSAYQIWAAEQPVTMPRFSKKEAIKSLQNRPPVIAKYQRKLIALSQGNAIKMEQCMRQKSLLLMEKLKATQDWLKISRKGGQNIKKTLKNRNADGQTTLSKYVWRKRDEGLNPQITWHFLEKNIPDFNPITEICKLCTREKYQIVLNPNVASLNLRTEIFSNCKHKESYLFGEPPD